ncbi:hypothetical protein EXN66_Car018236 [Channa argus]|uniref:Uncharacterized protein n=1 Tax=Channa argus TaxID=215402 RepID=A0A6G1QJX1_CHAAH|nr:hypothetical protein EXN66_Car018236 [Channa argus]
MKSYFGLLRLPVSSKDLGGNEVMLSSLNLICNTKASKPFSVQISIWTHFIVTK